MPLPDYGVAIGSLTSFTRDPQHSFGTWYHGHIGLDAGGRPWESALDVDAPRSVGVAYRLVTGLRSSDLGPVAALPVGWTQLAHAPASGALDYVRSPALRDGPLVRALRATLFARSAPAGEWEEPPFGPDPLDTALERLHEGSLARLPQPPPRSFPWIESSGDNALDALQPELEAATRIYIYGERYADGEDGVHDVHMNQGDPAGSQWFDSNGPWQDGAVACQRGDGGVAIWQVRFKTQSLRTDDDGHPV